MGQLSRRDGSERRRRPLAQGFTVRYAVAVVGFVALAFFGVFSHHAALDQADEAGEQLRATHDQLDRLHQIAADCQVLVDTGLDPASASPELRSDLTRVREELSTALFDFRNVQLGLTAGSGTSGLPAPGARVRQWWTDPDASRDAQLVAFHQDASRLTGLLGTASPDREEVEALNSSVQEAATPVTGWAARILEDAADEYADVLDRTVQDQRELNRAIVALTLGLALVAVLLVFRPMANRIHLETTALRAAEREARENNERQLFRNQLVLGLERASSEDEIFDRVQTALHEALPDQPAELLLADAAQAHLHHVRAHPLTGSPGCPVDQPSNCVAIARSQTVRFETSRALDVCPKLPRHDDTPCSAVCAPVRFLGQPLGVLHVTGPDLDPPDHQLMERINVIADEAGNRLGMLRTERETHRQASTDGLTGLPNRRSLESAAEEMIAAGRPFAVAIADLDHFKRLNDTHGHEAGDRALRLFARSLRTNLRPDDVAARHGGEEFVLLLPNTTVDEAERALDRLRVTLSGDIAASGTPPFTASWGLSSSATADSFSEMLATADEALYAAKRAGRDRLVVARAAGGSPPPPGAVSGEGAEPAESDPTGPVRCPACDLRCPPTTRYCLRCGSALGAAVHAAGNADADGTPDHGGADGETADGVAAGEGA